MIIPMNRLSFILFLAVFFSSLCFAGDLIELSSLDPELADRRDRVFTPWSTNQQASKYWKDLSSNHVPVYNDRKSAEESRLIYLPNPGIGYWVLGGLSKDILLRVHRDKLKIDDTLIAASAYTNEDGEKVYWALWAPRKKAHLLLDLMKNLGIGQARIELAEPPE